MEQVYEWDKRKAQLNLLKHKESFEEGETIFAIRFWSLFLTNFIPKMKNG